MNDVYRRSGIISPRCFQSQQIINRLPNIQLDHVFGPNATTALTLSSSGQSLASASLLGEMYIYNSNDWQYFSKNKTHPKFTERESADRRFTSRNFNIIHSNPPEKKEFSEAYRFACPSNIHTLQFYPHGERIIFSSSKHGFQIHDCIQGHLETLIKNPVESHDVSPVLLQAAVVNSVPNHTLTLVDISTGASLHRLNINTNKMNNKSRIIAKWSPIDSSILVVAKHDGIQFWDVRCAGQTPVSENKQGFRHPILALSFCKGGHGLLTCDTSGVVQLWSSQGTAYPFRLPRAFGKFSQKKSHRYSSTMPVVEKYNSPGFFFYHDTRTIVAQCIETGEVLNRQEVFEPITDLAYDEQRETLYVSSGRIYSYRPHSVVDNQEDEKEEKSDWQDYLP